MITVAIDTLTFNKSGIETLKNKDKGSNWPVVYILHNNKTAYNGETSNLIGRLSEHLDNPERSVLNKAEIIIDEEYNKSATLDVEQNLIRLYKADKKYDLQNRNAGQSASHDYYNRPYYQAKLQTLWKELRDKKLAKRSYGDLINSSLYKYSPYTCLTEEQMEIYETILRDIKDSIKANEERNFIVYGGAGTGKTILALNLLRTLSNLHDKQLEELMIDSNEDVAATYGLFNKVRTIIPKGNMKVALCIPMGALNKTITKVVKESGMKAELVLRPDDIAYDVGKKYDVVIIDESHRIKRRQNLGRYFGTFDRISEKMNFNPRNCTQLDWIIAHSKYRILFYDPEQSIKRSDIEPEQFRKTIGDCTSRTLTSQMRCRGGKKFIDYVNEILDCDNPRKELFSDDFDFRLFENIEDLTKMINEKERDWKLCRMVAGFSWEWKTQHMKRKEIKNDGAWDIEIQSHHYVWNTSRDNWILDDKKLDNEIGSIHTTQGFDLNYVGVIFGKEIDYDPVRKEITINRNSFFDVNVKNGVGDEKLKEYILNTYRVLMTRGIHGCYIFAVNNNLRDYLHRFVDY